MIKIMKAMKQLLIVIALLSCNTMLMATEYQLHQTSKATYKSIGSGGASGVGSNYAGVSSGKYSSAAGSVCPTSVSPMVNFHSTSAMIGSGSTLPNAAVSGFISADDNLPDSSPRGPRRIGGGNSGGGPGPNNPDDIYKDPLTDAVPCLLLLAIGYAIYLGRKTSVPNPDSRK